ncbi:ABC-2 type transport system permease protein [Halobacillus karajensis]|uniref:ABC-type transport system involved in multi-copper enzyme maturation, permease component n=1 Tax=Halobacillus karajensis TaxID=195088 RepID=A0A024P8S6_9BACI|nr:ABC transporter permease [Halobacillus karajensis]CDQ21254.1 ABC-type transport system involved in multi-copper enzyme maturation, permease component [Halobacillus karajensis]CDQ25330.1 ABC-type transport system involved in multi-copper enzyme maturation, permease component [Halobacillus karajensis]CDQ25947.1 ABC-type transport system involved in multi-copper enzyme maturation, permease component [Halobacillus karajensis]SEI10092.1 ABC-2 type transport system permease protein [Halobacillus k
MISVKRVQAVVTKDYKDLMKNSYMLSTALMPLLFAYIFSREGAADVSSMMVLCLTLTMVIVGSFIQAAMIAEEKEKNTLRGLLLSPLNIGEIFIGKSVLSAALTVIMVAVVIMIGGFSLPDQMGIFAAALFISLIFFIAVGTILGLISRTVMETSVAGLPVMLILGMGSLFRSVVNVEWITSVFEYIPDYQLTEIAEHLSTGESVTQNFIILSVWAVASVIVAVVIFKKRRFD